MTLSLLWMCARVDDGDHTRHDVDVCDVVTPNITVDVCEVITPHVIVDVRDGDHTSKLL